MGSLNGMMHHVAGGSNSPDPRIFAMCELQDYSPGQDMSLPAGQLNVIE